MHQKMKARSVNPEGYRSSKIGKYNSFKLELMQKIKGAILVGPQLLGLNIYLMGWEYGWKIQFEIQFRDFRR